jgi:hypothetical protein
MGVDAGARSTASLCDGIAADSGGAATVDGWCDSGELRMHRANGAVIVDMETAWSLGLRLAACSVVGLPP